MIVTCIKEPNGSFCLHGFRKGYCYEAETETISRHGEAIYIARIYRTDDTGYEPVSMRTFNEFFKEGIY